VCQLFSAFDTFTVSFPKPNYEATNTKQLYCNFHASTELLLSVLRNNGAMGLTSIRGGVEWGGGGICEPARGGRVQGEAKGIF